MKTVKLYVVVTILGTAGFMLSLHMNSTSSDKTALVHQLMSNIHQTTSGKAALVHQLMSNIHSTTSIKKVPAHHGISNTNQTTSHKTAPVHRMTDHHFKDVPDMTLTVRMSSKAKLLQYFYCTMLRSLTLYWSNHLGNLGVILDKESEDDHKFAENIQKYQEKLGINIKIYYEPLPKNKRVLTGVKSSPSGYNRQLYSSFIMDKFISTPIVAWIDTDSKFTTPVTPQNIISGKKIRVKGMNTFQHFWVRRWDKLTEQMIGKRMPSDFMTYFPVYIWRDTIINCRNYILKYVNVSTIDEAFIKVGSKDSVMCMSPVNTIMTYAFYFEKERYDWHIDIRNVNLHNYTKLHKIPDHKLTSTDMSPDLHVTLHDKYYKDDQNIVNRQAYCAAVNNTVLKMEQDTQKMCEPFKTKVMWVLFEFCNTPGKEQLTAWCKNKDKQCRSMIKEHYDNTRQLVNKGVYNLDLKRIKAVEEAANFHKIKCPSFL
ncbi:hypothetical protein SNE40_023477 [Patella caerulea]|uniref:Uncharacterized protein n=1 Tax=Patella caerulea TaxID=87958 RepID=A0AAN8GA75_PATCE